VPTVIAHHDISKGKDHWLSSPKREELFGPLGVTKIRTFVNPQNPNQVALLMDVPDLDAVMAAMNSDAVAEAMAHDGVVPETVCNSSGRIAWGRDLALAIPTSRASYTE
jgi:hypothetical protein